MRNNLFVYWEFDPHTRRYSWAMLEGQLHLWDERAGGPWVPYTKQVRETPKRVALWVELAFGE